MINQITINSNNAIELSRGQLLVWINSLLKVNFNKIQQFGSGAIYCQLLDIIYPGKISLSKVNWKAKQQYQYLNNFKILQQSFTKLGIMKHIDVEKLVKCKYQDNLQFLQWFKKIFDNNNISTKDYDANSRRGVIFDCKDNQSKKQNKYNSIHDKQSKIQQSQISFSSVQSKSKTMTERTNNIDYSPKLYATNQKIDENLYQNFRQHVIDDQKQLYLRKFKEIQHLMQQWNLSRSSCELIENIRKVILCAEQVKWKIQDGNFIQQNQNKQQQ